MEAAGRPLGDGLCEVGCLRSGGFLLAEEVGIPMATGFDGAHLGFEIYMDEAEARLIAFGPLKIVCKGPDEVAFEGYAFRFGLQHLGYVALQVCGPIAVVYLPTSRNYILKGGTIFGDKYFAHFAVAMPAV